MTSDKPTVGHIDEDHLIATYRPRIVYFALRRLRDRGLAEDVAQETLKVTFLALRENRLRDPAKLPAFVFGTARNLVKKFLREGARDSTSASDSIPKTQEKWVRDPDAALLLEEQRVKVRQSLEKLSSADRELLQRIYTEGESLEEISEGLGIENATVRQRKCRALERLRQIFMGLSQKESL